MRFAKSPICSGGQPCSKPCRKAAENASPAPTVLADFTWISGTVMTLAIHHNRAARRERAGFFAAMMAVQAFVVWRFYPETSCTMLEECRSASAPKTTSRNRRG